MSSHLFHNLENSLHFFKLAESCSQEKNFPKSLILLKLALKQNPDSPLIHFSISRTCHFLEIDLEALQWNDKTLEILEKLPCNIMNEGIKMNSYALRLEILEKINGMPQKIQETFTKFEEELSKSEMITPDIKRSLLEKIQSKNQEFSKNEKNIKYVKILNIIFILLIFCSFLCKIEKPRQEKSSI